MKHHVNVFFDESGKDKNQISLMGALLIPDDYYKSLSVDNLNTELKQKKFKMHFTDLKKSNVREHQNALKVVLESSEYLKFNVVAFKKAKHIAGHSLENKGIVEKMIYSKIPERVLYGVLRDFGNFSDVQAKLFIEECTQYKDLNLHKTVKDQLNVHSLYRHENYMVERAGLYSKNKELGIEITDTLLGILRTIVENKEVKFQNKEPLENYKGLWRRKQFIARNLNILEDFLCNINYFELDGHSKLEKRLFRSYLNLFLARYQREKTYRDQS